MNKKNLSFIIKCAIGVALYLIISHLPAVAPITVVGMELLGIVVCLIWGLLTIDSVLPSIFALILLGFTHYSAVGHSVQFSVMTASGGFVACLVLTLMLFSGVISQSGLAQVMAEKIVYSKIANGRPWMLTFLIMIAGWVPSMVLTNIPVIFVMWPIMYEMFKICGFEKGDKWPAVMMVAMTFSSLVGMTCMPFNVGVAGDFAILLSLDPTCIVPSGPFILSSIVLAVVILLILFLIIRFIIKPDVSKLQNYKSTKTDIKFNTDQKRGLVLMILLIVIILLPECLPACGLKDFLTTLGTPGAALVVVVIALFIRNKDGSPFMTFNQITQKGIFWPMLVMIASINAVCGGLSTDEVGIVAFIQQSLEPIVGGMSPFVFFALLVVIAYVLTNIFDGAVVAYVTIPIMYALAPTVGLTATALMACMTHNVQSGLALPSASPTAAMLFGNDEGWHTRKTAMKYGLVCAGIYLVAMIVVYYPFMKFM